MGGGRGGGGGLPDGDDRLDDDELYLEYLSIQQGSGYLPAMDGK